MPKETLGGKNEVSNVSGMRDLQLSRFTGAGAARGTRSTKKAVSYFLRQFKGCQ